MKRTLVIALVAAIAVAATSFAYAAIPAANGVISACKDTKGSLKVIDAEGGDTCNGNQQLLSWNQQGTAGADGQDGVSGYEIVTLGDDDTASEDFKGMEVECPRGKVPVGGGGAVVGVGGFAPDVVAITGSFPSVSDTGWVVVAKEATPTDVDWSIVTRVVCVSVAGR